MNNIRKLLNSRGILNLGRFKMYPSRTLHCVKSLNYLSSKKPLTTYLLDQFYGIQYMPFSSTVPGTTSELIDALSFENACEETLESLSDYFESLIENVPNLKSADITYSDGVLTVNLGLPHGTYVINRQSPNRQIWLSSPLSGPKRYDYVLDKKCWIYKHDGKSLHQLLSEELPSILKREVDFSHCLHSALS